jgi:hypothetical protein
VPCTGSSAASTAHCFPPLERDVRTGAQLNSWCSLRATSSSVSSLGSPESSDDAGTDAEVVCLGLGEGLTREGLGVGGFDRGLGLSHRLRAVQRRRRLHARRLGGGRRLELLHLSHAFAARQAGGERRSRREVAGGFVRGGVRALVTVAVLLRGVGGPGGLELRAQSLVFMLGYRLTADDEGERGSSGVEHPGTSASLLISTPGSFSPSHCLSLRLSMVSPGTRRGERYGASRAPRNPTNRRGLVSRSRKMRESPWTDSRSQQRRRVAGCARSVGTTRDGERGGKRPQRRARRAWQRAGRSVADPCADNSISRASFRLRRHASRGGL